jgi:hypothetical protein
MAILAQIGTTLIVGGQSAITNYIVESETTGSKEVAMEDIDTADGALSTRLIFKRLPTVDLSLISKASAAPATDFPQGDKAGTNAGTYSGWYVDSLSVVKTKSAEKSSVKLTSLGI